MLNELSKIFILPASGLDIIVRLTVAMICSILISVIYRHTYRGPGYSSTFINTIIAISMVTSVVIMVIGNNLARAFGLVGTMSLIRFRTAVKSTMDIVYIFFALAIGMAAGIGFYQIAVVSTLFIGLFMFVFFKLNFLHPEREEFLLQINAQPSDEKTPDYQGVLDKHCKKHKIINAKSLGEGNLLELSFYVKMKDKKKSQEFISELRKTKGVDYVNLFFDEDLF
jgi:Domain of unknown function (DUF4956)